VVTEYEEVKRYVQVPTKKQFIDYRPVQYDVEYVPIKTYEK
jgi:hypothetical protein